MNFNIVHNILYLPVITYIIILEVLQLFWDSQYEY